MAITQEELDRFHRFAAETLQAGAGNLSIEDLVRQWQEARARQEANAAIHQGIADIAAGNYRALDGFMDEFCRKHKIPKRG